MPTPPVLSLDKGLSYALSGIFLYLVVLGLFVGTKYLLKKIETHKPKEKDESAMAVCQGCAYNDFRDSHDLFKHSVFGFIRLARAVTIPNLPISEPGRKAVFEDLLDIKFRIVETVLLDWLKLHASKMVEMPGDMLASELLTLIAKVVERYEGEGAAIGIPLEVIEKFRFWHGKRVLQLQEEIEMVCASEWISETTHRVGFCLSVLEQVLRATMLDAEKALISLNGSLCGKVYKGFVLGAPCHKKSDI
jgi:hypothetical protein